MATDPIISFYSGGPDEMGRTLEQILTAPDDELEARHDFIQWLFPTSARSAFNPRAPLVTRDTVAAFNQRPELRNRMRQALDRMLAFYGLRRESDREGGTRIVLDEAEFATRARLWLRANNHNHLRLTRIMQSLAELGLVDESRALQRCLLEDVYDGPGSDRVTRETYEFWLAAVRR